MRPALIAAFCTLVAASLLPAAQLELKETRVDVSKQPNVTVTGTAEVQPRADMATINVGVVTEAESAAAALEQNNARMQRLFDNLRERGIDEQDMQTTNFNVSPKYQRHPESREAPKIVGYTVTNQVRVKVRRLSSLGQVLDEVVQEGANRVRGISFSIDDEANVMDEARKKAMADARRKAELLAGAAKGAKLGPVVQIRDQPTARPMPATRFRMSEAVQDVPVAPGEVTHTATVQVTYLLIVDEL